MKRLILFTILVSFIATSMSYNVVSAQDTGSNDVQEMSAEIERLSAEIESLKSLVNQLVAIQCNENSALEICPNEKEEDPLSDNYESGFPQILSQEQNPNSVNAISGFMDEFLNNLADYYNNESDAVLANTTENAIDIVGENRLSELYEDYELIDFTINSIVQVDMNTYVVNINRDYSHVSSNGPATDNVTYTIVNQNGELLVANY